jgi:hypothetical protein
VITKKRLAEICLVYLSGGRIAAGTKVDIREIYQTAEKIINAALKTSFFAENIGMGETLPTGLVTAEYSGIPIYKHRNVSASTLPIMPVKLPRNMGLFSISPDADVFGDFIPLMQGDMAKMQKEPLISDLLGQIGYEHSGSQIIYNKDLTINGTQSPTVTMRLVANNITDLDEYSPLPIPADMEWAVVQQICQFYGVEPNPDKLVDSGVQIPGQTAQI